MDKNEQIALGKIQSYCEENDTMFFTESDVKVLSVTLRHLEQQDIVVPRGILRKSSDEGRKVVQQWELLIPEDDGDEEARS